MEEGDGQVSRSWAGGSTRRWRKFRALILERDGYRCQVPKGGAPCGAHATHVDHIRPLADGGSKWDPANARAACAPCNLSRGTAGTKAGPTVPVIVVIGPPGGGKSTWVREHADVGDVVIDLDAIATALTITPPLTIGHDYPQHVRHVAIGARAAALRRAVALPTTSGARVYLVHAVPTPEQLRAYVADGWTVQVCDPGPAETRRRTVESDRQGRHLRAIDEWYVRADQLAAILGGRDLDPWEW